MSHAMGAVKVGIREFRERLAEFLESPSPVAITRHGETVGFYIPARRNRKEIDLDALRKAAAELDSLIASAGSDEQKLVQEFRRLRRTGRKSAA